MEAVTHRWINYKPTANVLHMMRLRQRKQRERFYPGYTDHLRPSDYLPGFLTKPATQTVQEEQDDDFLYDGTIQLNPDENGIKLSFSIRIYSPIMTLPT